MSETEGSGDGDATGDADRSQQADPRRAADHGGRPCPQCGAAMFRRHCKYVCPQHGVVYDCSDPFR